MSAGTDTDGIEFRLLRPEEAELLVACIRRCYGDTYIDPFYYDAQELGRRLADGRLHSVAAITEGCMVGHMGLAFRRPGDRTADAGVTLVDPDLRGRGIAHRVGNKLGKHAIGLGLLGMHDYPVTVHGATQRIGADIGIECGLMLSNMPAETTFNEIEGGDSGRRSASLIRWIPTGQAPRREVHAPERYRDFLSGVYGTASLERGLAPLGPASSEPTRTEDRIDRHRRTRRIAVDRIGQDFEAHIGAVVAAEPSDTEASFVDLPLAEPATPTACESLRDLGFRLAGVLPEFRDGDVLRLQRPKRPPEATDVPVLEKPESRALYRAVVDDLG